jgi:hypothetical protein
MFARRSIALGLALILSSAPLLAFQAPAPDLTGTWTGKFTMTNKEGTKEEGAHVVLKQTKADLSGTAGPSAERQFPINTGKVTTTKGETTVVFETGREGHVITFELKLVEGRLKGAVRDQFYPDNKMTAELQRQK